MAKYSIKDGMGIIPARTKIITRNAFRLTRIVIPETVKEIQPGAFNGCPDIESIVVSEDNPVYDSREDCDAIVETASNKMIVGCANTIIPNSVTEIGNHAFESRTGLTSIVIPNSVSKIGEAAFDSCSALICLVIPDSVTLIGNGAFDDCCSLEVVFLPHSLQNLEDTDLSFTGCTSLKHIFVPAAMLGSYKERIPEHLHKTLSVY